MILPEPLWLHRLLDWLTTTRLGRVVIWAFVIAVAVTFFLLNDPKRGPPHPSKIG